MKNNFYKQVLLFFTIFMSTLLYSQMKDFFLEFQRIIEQSDFSFDEMSLDDKGYVFVLNKNTKKILIFDLNAELKKTLNLNLESPTSMFIRNNKIFIADKDKIKIFDEDGNLIKEVVPLEKNLKFLPTKISVDGDENIYAFNSFDKSIMVFDYNGKKITKITNYTKNEKLGEISGIASWKDFLFFISDKEKNRVSLFLKNSFIKNISDSIKENTLSDLSVDSDLGLIFILTKKDELAIYDLNLGVINSFIKVKKYIPNSKNEIEIDKIDTKKLIMVIRDRLNGCLYIFRYILRTQELEEKKEEQLEKRESLPMVEPIPLPPMP